MATSPATIADIVYTGNREFHELNDERLWTIADYLKKKGYSGIGISPRPAEKRIVLTRKEGAIPHTDIESAVLEWSRRFPFLSRENLDIIAYETPQYPEGYREEILSTPHTSYFERPTDDELVLATLSLGRESLSDEQATGYFSNRTRTPRADVALIRETILERLQQGPANSSEIMGYLRSKELTPGTISNDLQALRKKGLAKPRGKRSTAIWSLNKT